MQTSVLTLLMAASVFAQDKAPVIEGQLKQAEKGEQAEPAPKQIVSYPADAVTLHEWTKGGRNHHIYNISATYSNRVSRRLSINGLPIAEQNASSSGTARGFQPLGDLLAQACRHCLSGGANRCHLTSLTASHYERGNNGKTMEGDVYLIALPPEVNTSCPLDGQGPRVPQNAQVSLIPIQRAAQAAPQAQPAQQPHGQPAQQPQQRRPVITVERTGPNGVIIEEPLDPFEQMRMEHFQRFHQNRDTFDYYWGSGYYPRYSGWGPPSHYGPYRPYYGPYGR